MRVLVTGGAGYIGSHTTQKLIEAGHHVVVYDNLSSGFLESIPKGAEFVLGDVLDTAKLQWTLLSLDIEAVIHFAAKLTVPESLKKPLDYYENNTKGVLSLAKASVSSRINKIVFSSTAAVYGDFVGAHLVSESTQTRPINPYGLSKLKSEYLLRDCEKPYGLKSVSLRYFNVAGAAVDGSNGQRTKNATHLIKVASEAACGMRPNVGVFGTDYDTKDGTGVRDYIHVEDLADVHVLALQYLNSAGESQIFNCGYGEGYSVREVLKTMQLVSGSEFAIQNLPRREGDASSLVADNSKVKKFLKWQPQRNNLRLICESAWKWEQAQLGRTQAPKASIKNKSEFRLTL